MTTVCSCFVINSRVLPEPVAGQNGDLELFSWWFQCLENSGSISRMKTPAECLGLPPSGRLGSFNTSFLLVSRSNAESTGAAGMATWHYELHSSAWSWRGDGERSRIGAAKLFGCIVSTGRLRPEASQALLSDATVTGNM